MTERIADALNFNEPIIRATKEEYFSTVVGEINETGAQRLGVRTYHIDGGSAILDEYAMANGKTFLAGYRCEK